jgi:hypothetical protein
MRMLGGLVATTLCALAAATPARALGDLQNCDAIKDAGQRMACLQAHIAHLEQTLLSLNSDLVDLQHELKEKLSVNSAYKLQYVGRGTCLGYADKDKPPIFVGCDHPDSWKLVRGSQSPGRVSTAPKSSDTSADQSSDTSAGQPSDKPSGKQSGKSSDKSSGKSKNQPKAEQAPPN